jgi:hypothetical protein
MICSDNGVEYTFMKFDTLCSDVEIDSKFVADGSFVEYRDEVIELSQVEGVDLDVTLSLGLA